MSISECATWISNQFYLSPISVFIQGKHQRIQSVCSHAVGSKSTKISLLAFKGFIDQTYDTRTPTHTQTHRHTPPNLPGGRAICAAAGVDDWLVVIETAKGKFLPDALSLIPLGLQEENRYSFKEQKTMRTTQLVHQLTMPAEGRNQRKANNKDKRTK